MWAGLPVGAAPTTSEWSTILLPKIRCISYYSLTIIFILAPEIILLMDEIRPSLKGFLRGMPFNGVVVNGATITQGQHDGALHINGINQRVNFGDHRTECFHQPDVCSMGVTYALWLRRMRTGSREVFLDTGAFDERAAGYAMFHSRHHDFRIAVFDQHFHYFAVVPGWPINKWDHLGNQKIILQST